MLGGAVAFFIMTPVIALIIFFGVKQRDEILKRRPDETDEEYNFRVQEERKKWKMQDEQWVHPLDDLNNTTSNSSRCLYPQNFFYVEPFHYRNK